jgi:hypothetical protein
MDYDNNNNNSSNNTTKREAKTEIAEMKFLRSVAGYTRRDQINIKIRK